ncbi:hypothetical protein GGE07_006512 [Sinorhizobium terangae]|uniref:Uncharacterized protein n=1 Tax=Sinorhizobium terangae TaxID=110322 RepID=A0A6N7LKI9_SINTE|nr:hypothetical protein [Sinorhizobium terangae]MBB4189808.1 hypothetical protein [Sinorhizobium terangae]MQX17345.1 hypothetical protein [Sinorhizobium terangae]
MDFYPSQNTFAFEAVGYYIDGIGANFVSHADDIIVYHDYLLNAQFWPISRPKTTRMSSPACSVCIV